MSESRQGQPDPTLPTEQTALPNAQPDLVAAPGEPKISGVATNEINIPAKTAAARIAHAAGTAPTNAERGSVRSVHYSLSYIVRHAERGPRGAIVLLHDLPGGAFTWADTFPRLEATGRAVYAFDLLSYGESEHAWPSDTSIWGHADTLSYAFEALGLRDITLVGFGLGGAVAQVLATRLYRERTAQLVLMASYAYDYAFSPDWPLPEMVKRQDPDAPKHIKTEDFLRDLRATLPKASANPTYLAGSKLDAYTAEWNSEVGKELLYQHIRLMLPIYSNSVAPYLRKLEIPTLLIWGQSDNVTLPALGERLRRDIPGARLETIPGAGHLLLDDAPDAVATLIADFAGALTPAPYTVAR